MSSNRSSIRIIVSGFGIIVVLALSVAAESSWSDSFFGSIREFFGAASTSIGLVRASDDLTAVTNGPIIFQRGFAAAIDFPYNRGGQLFKVDPVSRAETFFINGSQPNYSADGSKIVFTINAQLATLPAVNPSPSPSPNLLVTPGGSSLLGFYPKWSPDSSNISYNVGTTVNGTPAYHVKIIGGNCTACDISNELNPAGTTNYVYPSWHPTIGTSGTNRTAKLVFVRTSATRSDFDQGNYNGDIFSEDITIAQNGTVTEGNRLNLTNSPGQYAFPAYSHDGTKIAYINFATVAGNNTLNVMNADGTNNTAIVTFPNSGDRYAHHPAWSPDDTKIAFSDSNQIFQVTTAAPFTVSQVSNTLASANDLFPSWAPGTGIPTPTPTPLPFSATLSFDGRLRDRVGKSDSGIPLDGESDGTFSLTLPAATFSKSIASVALKGPNGNEWDTIKQAPSPSALWAVGVARGLDISLENQADGTLASVPVGNTGTFKLFIGDSIPSSLVSGRNFSVTVTFTDGTTATASTTITLNAADLSTTFGTAPPATTPFGSFVTFRYIVANNGPETAKGVVFTTTVDSKLPIQSVTDAAGCLRTGQALTCVIGDLGPGATKNIVISTLASQGGTATNSGTVTQNAAQSFDPNISNNTVSANTLIGKANVVLTGLEVTQGVQDVLNTMPLVAGRATFVRAYVKNLSGIPFSAGASLTLKNAATGATLGTLPSGNAGGTIPILTDPQRVNLDDSFYFQVPNGVYLGEADWTTPGPVDISFASNDFNLTCGEPDGASDCKTRVTFKTGRDFSVKIFLITYTDAAGNSYSTTNADAFNALSELATYFPIARFSSISLGTMNTRQQFCTGGFKINPATGKPTENGIGKVLTQLKNIRANDCGANLPNYSGVCQSGVEDYYLGLLPFTATVCPAAEAGGLGSQPTGGIKVRTDNSGNVSVAAHGILNNRAHEVGHNFGFPHSCTSTAATGGCSNIVPSDGTLSVVKNPPDSPSVYYGFDVFNEKNPGDTTGDGFVDPGFKDHARPWGPKTTDFMGYTEPSWPSSYNFRRLVDALTLGSSTGKETEEPEPARPSVGSNKRLLLDGFVSLSTDTGTLGSVYTIDQAGTVTLPPAGTYAIRYDDASGNAIATYSFEPDGSSEGGDYSQFSLVLPWDANTRRIDILHNGQVIGTRQASAHPPTVTVTSPNGGETLSGQSATVTWNASDSDGDTLSYSIDYSVDAGATWKSLGNNWPAKTYSLDPTTLPATTQGLIRVTASDGFDSAQDQSNAVFTIPPHGALAAITTPENNHIYVGNQSITLNGLGIDSKDGALGGANLTWTSNLNGLLGTGSPLIIDASTLVEGTHTITLSARNSAGLTGTSLMSIKVFRNRPVFPAALSAGPKSLDFEPRTSLQTLSVRNSGDGDLTWTATTDQPWIKLSATSGVAPANVDVTIIPGGLPYGNLTGKITLTSPEAANGPQVVNVNLAIIQGTTANLDGRVVTPDARGLRSATVTMTDSQGVVRSATTSSFGFFSFPDTAVGETYTIRIGSRSYRFAPRTMQIISDLTLADFVGLE